MDMDRTLSTKIFSVKTNPTYVFPKIFISSPYQINPNLPKGTSSEKLLNIVHKRPTYIGFIDYMC